MVRREQRATILDVAARAGVHAATVSRTINVPEKVAPETRRRVEAAIEDLGFVPNRAARGLITGRTGNVAVIVPDITNPHFAALVRSVERSARQSDLQVLLVDTGEHADDEVRAVESLSREVDGFIVVSPRRLHRALGALGVHAGGLCQPSGARARLHPPPDGARRGRGAASTSPGSDMRGWPTSADRAGRGRPGSAAARCGAAARAAGIDVRRDRGERADLRGHRGRRARHHGQWRHRRARVQRPDGARRRRRSAQPRDRRYPKTSVSWVSTTCPMAAMVAPPLTTISLPTAEVGAVAVAMLGEGPARRELFGELVVRHSTARVR